MDSSMDPKHAKFISGQFAQYALTRVWLMQAALREVATLQDDIAGLRELYAPFQRNHEKLLIMDLRDNLLAQAPYIAAQANPQYLGNAGTGKVPASTPTRARRSPRVCFSSALTREIFSSKKPGFMPSRRASHSAGTASPSGQRGEAAQASQSASLSRPGANADQAVMRNRGDMALPCPASDGVLPSTGKQKARRFGRAFWTSLLASPRGFEPRLSP